MLARPVKRWIVCIAGFRQAGHRPSGMAYLHRALHHECADRDTFVVLRSWRDSAEDMAERIFQWRTVGQPTRIMLAGYSYGGYSAVLTARALADRGIMVDELLLVDAVWRPYEAVPSWLSMRSFWTIRVPDNVHKVWVWRQTVNRPAGHHVQVPHGTACIRRSLAVAHEYMDDAKDVHETALRVARGEL